jgi:hypothetical protein
MLDFFNILTIIHEYRAIDIIIFNKTHRVHIPEN